MKTTIKALIFWASSAACLPSFAADFSLGDGLRGQLSGMVTWGAQFRTEAASPDVYADWPSRSVPGAAKGTLQGQAGGAPCADAVSGKTCTSDGYISARAWGWKMRVTATYPQALWGITLTPSILLAKDVQGYSYDGAFSEGRSLIRPAVRAEIDKIYFAEIQYNRFSGGRYNLLADRDFVSVMAGVRF